MTDKNRGVYKRRKSTGPKVAAPEPENKTHQKHHSATGQTKQPDCVFWPEAKPTTDITGRKVGRLTMLHPVYVMRRKGDSGRVWYWLAVCSCPEANEIIICNTNGQTGSCGCLRKEGRRRRSERDKAEKEARRTSKHRAPEKTLKFDRFTICNRLPFQCKHYRECGDERADFGRISKRYLNKGGICYEAGREESRLNAIMEIPA